MTVVSADETVLGWTSDFVIDLDKPQPEVIELIYRKKRSTVKFSIKWQDVQEMSGARILISSDASLPVSMKTLSHEDSLVLLREFLLDKQIVDVHGAKVERVNDLKFLESDGKLILVQVDVGLVGLLRRLGVENQISRFL